MPISEPLKVSISPKAMRSEWWISPTGGVKSPAASNAHPKAHMAVAIMSWSRFISSVWLYLLCPLGKKSKLSKPRASVFSWDSLDLCEHASKEVKFPCFRAHPCSSVGHIFPLITLIYTEPRGSFIRQLRRTRSDRSNECEIRIWETIKINYLLGALSILSYLLSILSLTYSAYPCKSVRSVGGNISYALRARNPNYPNQRHPFLVEIV